MRTAGRLALILSLLAGAVLLASPFARADDPVPRATGDRTPTGAGVGASSGENHPGSDNGGSVARTSSRGGGGRGSGPRCFLVPYARGTGPASRPDETVYQRICPSSGGVTFESGAQLTMGPGGPAGSELVIDPMALARHAADELMLAEPVVRLNPAGDQIVQLPSWLWLEGGWTEQSASASAGPVTSTVTATPMQVRWSMGNGEQVLCDGPGRRYEPRFAETPEATDCKYTYRHSSAEQPGDAYQVTATVEWSLTWTAIGAPGGGDLGAMERSTVLPVRVAELQALVQ